MTRTFPPSRVLQAGRGPDLIPFTIGDTMRGEHVTIAILGVIVAHEIDCIRRGHPDDLISRVCDRARATHPAANALILAWLAATAGHLARIVPPKWDLYALVRLT